MALPATMTAIEITAPGGPEVLKPATRPLPVPKTGEILIKVAAAGVNRPDVAQRAGSYPPPPGASDLPGLEIAGEVVAMAPDVTDWKIGDMACALTSGGGYAEYCVAPGTQALPIPKGLTLTEAASLPETFFTVWTNIFDRAGLKPGEKFLVHGGSSGIGVAAIQMATAMGAEVYATAGSAEKCAACEKLGAKRAINYRTEDFFEVLRGITDKKGVDVILDMVGGSYIQKDLLLLAPEGRLALIAFLGGSKAEVDFVRVLMNRLRIVGSTLRPQSVAAKAVMAKGLRANIWPLIEAGRIKPVIDSTFPLADAAKAHARMESSAHIGKIMLTV